LQALQLNFPSLDPKGVVAVGLAVYAEGHLFILRHQPALPYHLYSDSHHIFSFNKSVFNLAAPGRPAQPAIKQRPMELEIIKRKNRQIPS
jgi:hypothetical protein